MNLSLLRAVQDNGCVTGSAVRLVSAPDMVILKLLWRATRKIMWGMTVIQDLLSKLHDKGWTWEAIAEEVTVYKWRVGIQTPSNGGLVRVSPKANSNC